MSVDFLRGAGAVSAAAVSAITVNRSRRGLSSVKRSFGGMGRPSRRAVPRIDYQASLGVVNSSAAGP